MEIEKAALHVAREMAEVWIDQARSCDPPTFKLAILAARKQLGSFGDAFYTELSVRLLHKETLAQKRAL